MQADALCIVACLVSANISTQIPYFMPNAHHCRDLLELLWLFVLFIRTLIKCNTTYLEPLCKGV
jgi:multisubunit Na+/H+ antiporter MnhE subunit